MFTLVACLFFIIILLLVNIGLINKKANQEKKLTEISKAYEINEQDMENTYAKIADANDYLTRGEIEQLLQDKKKEWDGEIEQLLQDKKKEWDKEQTYNPGDTYYIENIRQAGYVTGGGKSFKVTVYLDKLISKDVKSITATVPGGIAIRQNGNYILGNANEGKVSGYTVTGIESNLNVITFEIQVNTVNAKTINNDAVGIVIRNMTLKFH